LLTDYPVSREVYLMKLIGEDPSGKVLPRRPVEYYYLRLLGETPSDWKGLPGLPEEYYLMVLTGEAPDLDHLPGRNLEYYYMKLVGETPPGVGGFYPNRPLDFYLTWMVARGWRWSGRLFYYLRMEIDEAAGVLVEVSNFGVEPIFYVDEGDGSLWYSGNDSDVTDLVLDMSTGALYGNW